MNIGRTIRRTIAIFLCSAALIAFLHAEETIGNGILTASVNPELGRLTTFCRCNRPNILWRNPPGQPFAGTWPDYRNPGGDKIWAGIEKLRPFIRDSFRPDSVLDGQPWRITGRTDDTVVMTSQTSPELGVQITRKFQLLKNVPVMMIDNTLDKRSASVFPVQIWSVSQMVIPRSVELAVDHRSWGCRTFYRYFDSPATGEITQSGQWRKIPRPAQWDKVYALGNAVAATCPDGGKLVQLIASPDPEGCYPEGASIQVFWGPDYVELETLSPAVHLKTGEQFSFRVFWILAENDEQMEQLIELCKKYF